MSDKTIEEVLAEHTDELMSIPGVNGVAQTLCNERPGIVVYVIESSPELTGQIPESIEGFPVTVEVMGEIKKRL